METGLAYGEDHRGDEDFFLQEGRNCWRRTRAERVAFLIDAAAYFRAVREAFIKARRCIRILAWDIDSKTRLVDGDPGDGYPVILDALLGDILERNPQLEIYVLCWNSGMYYAIEREWFPLFGPSWRWRDRFHYYNERGYSLAASHHQKVIAIDDAIAFSGGLDLTRERWDTPEHRAIDPRRTDARGRMYQPFHDVAVLMDGGAARDLAELFCRRWSRATGVDCRLFYTGADPWPRSTPVNLQNAELAIARTLPEYNGESAVTEIEQLCLDMIRSAERYIYAEEQYLTSSTLGDALCESLQREHGPEMVLVLRRESPGLVEYGVMDVLRARLLRRLRAADSHGRLRPYYPHVRGLPAGEFVNVHSKVLIVDDRLLRIGSANMTNRSLRVDTECDIVFDGTRQPHVKDAIVTLLYRLLGEHLGKSVDLVRRTHARERSLIATIERLQGRKRTLRDFDGAVSDVLDQVIPESALIDPPGPLVPNVLTNGRNGKVTGGRRRRARGGSMTLPLALLGLAWLWRRARSGERPHQNP